MSAYLKKLVDELTDAGLELPVPVARYLAGEAVRSRSTQGSGCLNGVPLTATRKTSARSSTNSSA